jgi:hypothetical protein
MEFGFPNVFHMVPNMLRPSSKSLCIMMFPMGSNLFVFKFATLHNKLHSIHPHQTHHVNITRMIIKIVIFT